jgi:hypothetical protein
MGYTNVAHYPEGKQGWMEAGDLRASRVFRTHPVDVAILKDGVAGNLAWSDSTWPAPHIRWSSRSSGKSFSTMDRGVSSKLKPRHTIWSWGECREAAESRQGETGTQL